jgi:hypothetical protein
MMERTKRRLKELWAEGQLEIVEEACVILYKFWSGCWKKIKDSEGANELFRFGLEENWKTFLYEDKEEKWENLAGYLFPALPSEEEIGKADSSNYYRLTQDAFLEMLQEKGLP